MSIIPKKLFHEICSFQSDPHIERPTLNYPLQDNKNLLILAAWPHHEDFITLIPCSSRQQAQLCIINSGDFGSSIDTVLEIPAKKNWDLYHLCSILPFQKWLVVLRSLGNSLSSVCKSNGDLRLSVSWVLIASHPFLKFWVYFFFQE